MRKQEKTILNSEILVNSNEFKGLTFEQRMEIIKKEGI
jgi:hypothetical protein